MKPTPPLRRTARTSSDYTGSILVHARRGGPFAVATSVVEPLESRMLFAIPSGFEDKRIAKIDTGTAPTMEFTPDGRLFIADTDNGQIRVLKNNTLLTTPALNLPTDNYRERGINGMTFDPSFATNGYVYIYYTKPDPTNPNVEANKSVNRLSRFKISSSNPDVIDKNSELVLLDNIATPTGFHNGGAMHFGADGMLYLGVGEGGVATNANNLANLNGKVLRLNVANPANLIPVDNPFVGQAGKRGEIWAYGFRNPFSGDMKPGTNTLFINDVGDASWEEVNLVQKGKFYGWPGSEGMTTKAGVENPIYTYPHNGARAAVTGGAFYFGNQLPASYQGKYFFGDYNQRVIRLLDPADNNNVTLFADGRLPITDIDVAPDGSLWYLAVFGEIRRIRFIGAGTNRAPEATIAGNPTSGIAPLEVNFTAQGSTDPDGDTLSYAWNFGDGETGAGRDIVHAFDSNGVYTVRVTVSDGKGGSDSATTLISVGNEAPVGTILTPLEGQVYRGAQTINFSATATDAQDDVLPDSAYVWSVAFHHADHTHPFLAHIVGKSGSFVAPVDGEFDADQFYRIHLTVTDSSGLTHTSFRDVRPKTSTITLATNVPGIGVILDGQPKQAPHSFLSVEGMVRTLGAPVAVTLNGKAFEFVGWADGGSGTRKVVTPESNPTYTALYEEAGSLPPGWQSADVGNVVTAGSASSSSPNVIRVRGAGYDIGGTADAFNYAYRLLSGNGQIIARLADMLPTAPSAKVGVMIRETTSARSKHASLFITPRSGMFLMTRRKTGEATGVALVKSGTLPRWLSVTRSGETILYHTSVDGIAWQRLASSTLTMAGDVLIGLAVTSRDEQNLNIATFDNVTTTGNVAQGILPAADAFVRDGASATSNFGLLDELAVKRTTTTGNNRELYIKFDLTGMTDVRSAKLRLFGRLVSDVSPTADIAAYGTSDVGWGEKGITWSTKPTASTGALATTQISGFIARWYEWDLTAYVKSELAAGRKAVGFVLKSLQVTDPHIVFNSAEAGTSSPELLVVT